LKVNLQQPSPPDQNLADVTRRADILQRVMASISSGLALDPLLSNILDSAITLIEATHGTIGLVIERDGEPMIRTVAVYNMPEEELGAEMASGFGLAGTVLRDGRTVQMNQYGDLEKPTTPEFANHSVIGVPIRWGEKMIGFFGIGIEAPNRFDTQDAETLELFAQYAAVAIHNANLFKANQNALDEMRLLYETSQRIGLSDHVDGVIEAYLGQVAAGGQYICNICLYDFDENGQRTAVVVRGRWSPQDGQKLFDERLPYFYDQLDPILDTGQTIAIADVRTDPRVSTSLRELQEESGRWALAMIPLMVRSQRIGLVVLSHHGVHKWKEENLGPYRTVAAQLAIAIDHRTQQSLLHEREQQLAVLRERQRLARELHDSVTQLIFSTTLIAQSVAPAWRRDPLEGERRVERLLDLNQTALREMRSLLFELSPSEEIPATLTGLERIRHYGILGALRLLAKDFSQDGVSVTVEVDEAGSSYFDSESGRRLNTEPMLEESVYRIVQEALNNATKYAHAHQVFVQIKGGLPNRLCFSVTDDGKGFTPETTGVSNGLQGSGLGMKTMRERAEALGGTLRVISALTKGTSIEVLIPLKETRQ
jgi:signal transduction histidine kinase